MTGARSAESTASSGSLPKVFRSEEETIGPSRRRMPPSVAPTVW